MSRARLVVLMIALAVIALSVTWLEGARAGLRATALNAPGVPPATVWRRDGAEGPAPVAIIAHGFAGSRQLMEGFAVTLARAGYIAVAFDFAGHGRNPVPMSGDVTRIEGTTQRLMDEVAAVTEAALALPGADGRVALIGHSMASDVVVRQAVRDPRVGAVVAVSMFSLAVSETAPRNLLVVTGAWEGFLAAEALRVLRLADHDARMGETVGDPGTGMSRRAVLAPGVEHVGVLYSATTLRETRDWLDAAFGRQSADGVAQRGGWIALLLAGIVALGWPLSHLLGRFRAVAVDPPRRLSRQTFVGALIGAGVAVPLALSQVETRVLPVLVADYLALHLALYGLVLLEIARRSGALRARLPERADVAVAVAVALFGIAGFGLALDRYVAAFWPTDGRWPILLAVVAGTVPFLMADAVLTEGGRAPLWRVVMVRAVALASLGLAVALDFERLFFLVIILPVILLFFVLFGTVGGWAGRASGRRVAVGVGLGAFLGWALAVTFPLFQA